MTDLKPQDTAGVFKRLSFEAIGGDDFARGIRTQKGLTREITTPKISVPLSKEGTRLQEYVDRNEVVAAVRGRDEIVRLIVFFYPGVKLKTAVLSYITNNTAVKELFQVKFLRGSPAVSPETFTNG